VFLENQKNILRENCLDPELNDSLRKSCSFLDDLAFGRKHLYHTHKARELWEDKAKENIRQLLDMVRASA
jgi:predicted metal-dependent HD superfamily phosphohydrolase